MKTKITDEGWMVIEGDLISGWVESEKKLDHDAHLIPFACEAIPEGGIVIDAGANIGSHAVAYAKKAGANGTVLAIEAGATAYECLVHNAEKFDGTVLCMNVALCDIHGGTAHHEVNEVNLGASFINSKEKEKDSIAETHAVRTATIDGIVSNGDFPRLDFIKIDCEGCEFKILKGSEITLKQFKPVLLIEINSHRLAENDTSDIEIYDFLLKMNYSWRIVQPDCTGSSLQFDIICWPNLIEKPSLMKAEKIDENKN